MTNVSRWKKRILEFGMLLAVSLSYQSVVASPQKQIGRIEAKETQVSVRQYSKALYDRMILANGDFDGTVGGLTLEATDQVNTRKQRAEKWLVASYFYLFQGQLAAAIKAATSATELDPSRDEAILHRAQLLDMSGQTTLAKEYYQIVLSRSGGEKHKSRIRLRLALMQSDYDNFDDLVGLARSATNEERQRIAVILALMSRHKDAITLYDTFSNVSAVRFMEQIRVAHWAIHAGDLEQAKAIAWRAIEESQDSSDRRYGLSVLVEAHRADNSLGSLIDKFRILANTKQSIPAEVEWIWINLLQELGHVDEVVTIIRSGALQSDDMAQRHRRLQLYLSVGEEKALEKEYIRLKNAQPSRVETTLALAEYYLDTEQLENARNLWREFLELNSEDEALLLTAVQAMAPMGLDALAIGALEKYMGGDIKSALILFQLYELHAKNGHDLAARDTLVRLDRMLAPGDGKRIELAAAYERLQLPERALSILENLAKSDRGLTPDDTMRLARLYESLGRHDEELDIWVSLWRRELSPARRKLVRDQLLSLATKQKRLLQISAELERKLSKGESEPFDIDLLLSIYAGQHDNASVQRVISEYFDSSLNSLRELAGVYARLGDTQNYDRVNGQLVHVDPKNKMTYLRNQLLARLEQADEGRTVAVRKLLKAIREHHAAPNEGIDFEASVLARLGLAEEAISAYRRAVVIDSKSDNSYTMIGNLMNKGGHNEEALAMYQVLALDASDDDQFATAIDGLLSTIDAIADSAGDGIFYRTIDWAKRITLERMALNGTSPDIYELVANLADVGGDYSLQLEATENMLAAAGQRRDVYLRRLASLVERADLGRALKYGWRLLNLNADLPPDMFLDLSALFLKGEDEVGAVTAINRATSDRGRPDIMARAADLLVQTGDLSKALGLYSRAHNLDKQNISILRSLAYLQETLGRRDEANHSYSMALNLLIRTQPVAKRQSTVSDRSDEILYTNNYSDFVRGLLATFPLELSDQDASLAALINEVEDALSQTLAAERVDAGATALGKLEYYPRLNAWIKYARRMGYASGRSEFVERLDRMLVTSFQSQSDFVRSAAAWRLNWGFVDVPQKSAKYFASRKLPHPVRSTGQKKRNQLPNTTQSSSDADESVVYAGELNISILEGDQHKGLNAAQAWVKIGNYGEAVLWAEIYLEAAYYKKLCEYVATRLRTESDQYLLKLFTNDENLLKRVENGIGGPIFTEEKIWSILMANSEESAFNIGASHLVQKLSHKKILDLLQNVVARNMQSFEVIGAVANLWPRLMERPLTPDQSIQIADLIVEILHKYYGPISPSDVQTLNVVLFNSNIDKAHAELMRTVSSAWRRRIDETQSYFDPLILMAEGRTKEALDVHIELLLNTVGEGHVDLDDFAKLDILTSKLMPEHRAGLLQRVDAIKDSGASFSAAARIREYLSGISIGAIRDHERDVALSANDQPLLVHLYKTYTEQGYVRQAAEVLNDLYLLNPRRYRNQLIFSLIKADMPGRAVQLVGKSANRIRIPDTSIRPYQRPMDRLKNRIVQAVNANDMNAAKQYFRMLWRGLESNEESSQSLRTVAELLDVSWPSGHKTLLDGRTVGKKEKLFEHIVTYEFSIGELEDYLRSMTIAESRATPELFGYLAKAYRQHGLARKMIASLGKKLGNRTADDVEFTLWISIVADWLKNGSADEKSDISKNEFAAVLDEYGPHYDNLSPKQLAIMASIYAMSGEKQIAAKIYRQLLVNRMDQHVRSFRILNPKGSISALALVEEVCQYLDRKERNSLVSDIIRLSQPIVGEGLHIEKYDLFRILAWGKCLDADEALSMATRKIGRPVPTWPTGNLIETMRLQVRAGKMKSAIKLLKYILLKDDRTELDVIMKLSYHEDRAYSRYIDSLGLPIIYAGFSDSSNYRDKMYGDTGSTLDREKMWMAKVAEALSAWVVDTEPTIDKDLALQDMLLIADRLYELGNRRTGAAMISAGSVELSDAKKYSIRTIEFALAMSDKFNVSLDLDAMISILNAGRLPIEQIAPLVARVANSRGWAAALELGEDAAQYTHNDALLVELIELGKKSGDVARLNVWLEVRRNACAARTELRRIQLIVESESDSANRIPVTACGRK